MVESGRIGPRNFFTGSHISEVVVSWFELVVVVSFVVAVVVDSSGLESGFSRITSEQE